MKSYKDYLDKQLNYILNNLEVNSWAYNKAMEKYGILRSLYAANLILESLGFSAFQRIMVEEMGLVKFVNKHRRVNEYCILFENDYRHAFRLFLWAHCKRDAMQRFYRLDVDCPILAVELVKRD